ncbi:uncharacterized protein LOC131446677 [Solea solea]|uniref:uncharacterized protein LOC131446677 n=1 Tax=Solea solea TaxID=90069 RepID=UPI00272BC8B3|nr:uncharacterized protein LOC131446677 [Solea solea]
MADDKPDLESLQRRRSNAQRSLTTRINRLNFKAGRLGTGKLSQELAGLENDYDIFVDACCEYIEDLEQIDSTDDNCELRDTLTKRDAIGQRYHETMEMLWFKDAEPVISTLVARFNSAFDQAEELGRKSALQWCQQEARRQGLDQELHELRDAVYVWKDYRPYGEEKWRLLLTLEIKKKVLMEEWARRRDNKRGGGLTRPVTCASTTPLVHTHSAIRQGTIAGTSPPHQPPQPLQQPNYGPTVSFTQPPTLTSIPRPPGFHTAPTNTSMGQRGTVPTSNFGTVTGGEDSSQWAQPIAKITPISLPKISESRKADWKSIQAQAGPTESFKEEQKKLKSQVTELQKVTKVNVKKVEEESKLRAEMSELSRELSSEKTQTDELQETLAQSQENLTELQSDFYQKESEEEESTLHQDLKAPEERLSLAQEDLATNTSQLLLTTPLLTPTQTGLEAQTKELKRSHSSLESELTKQEQLKHLKHLVILSLESRLSEKMLTQWLAHVSSPKNYAFPGNHFEKLLLFLAPFLKGQRSLLTGVELLKFSKPIPIYTSERPSYHEKPVDWRRILEGVEKILKARGFYLKPWVRSGQSGRKDEAKPDQMTLLTKGEVDVKAPNPLTCRVLLSQITGLYDPIDLTTPVKQKGAIPVRKASQEAGKFTKDTWEESLSDELRGKAIELFKEYTRLGSIKFHRSLTPSGWRGEPWGITFSDGSCESYRAVLYQRWETSDGVVTGLVDSKAKLTPLNQKGNAGKAKICGAFFATRLKEYMLKHGRLTVEKWYHFIDSQTVLGAIQRDSYGFQTFFANRVGGIQKAGPVTDWRWIPGEVNVADLVTRGCSPKRLDENSAWQKGPEFLSSPVKDWPMKSPAKVAADATETVSKLQKKDFTAALTRTQAQKLLNSGSEGRNFTDRDSRSLAGLQSAGYETKSIPVETKKDETLGGAALIVRVGLKRYNPLAKLCGGVSHARKAVKKWVARIGRAPIPAKWEVVLTVTELETAFQDPLTSSRYVIRDTVMRGIKNRLVVNKDEASGLLRCYGRVQAITWGNPGVPLVPYNAWISTLLTREAHGANHEGIAGTLLRVRSKAWVVQGPRIARSIIDSCVHCRKTKARLCRQQMSELPSERSEPAAPFELTALDLFGPYVVRDTVKRRTKMKVWGVVFSCMASRALHADIVEDLSTDGFLKAYQRFTALRGHPRKLWSDQGTNFVGAKPALKELYEFLNNIDKDQVQKKATAAGTDWSWVFHPADSPHRNGAAEAAVHTLKRALKGVESHLTALEFQTLLYLAGVITPNSLLLGRAGPSGDSRGFEYLTYPVACLRAVQIEVDKCWKRWSQLAGERHSTRCEGEDVPKLPGFQWTKWERQRKGEPSLHHPSQRCQKAGGSVAVEEQK